MTEPTDLLEVECPRCAATFVVTAHTDVTTELAAIAKEAGAIDFTRDVDCPQCGALVAIRPPN